MPIPRANRGMNNALRKERDGLSAYMYGGDEPDASPVPPEEISEEALEGPDAAVIAVKAPSEAPPEDLPVESFTVLEPGEEDPPDMYVYAQGEAPGTWTVYPPGVPCDTEAVRVALDHPATEADLARMNDELGGEGSVPVAAEAY